MTEDCPQRAQATWPPTRRPPLARCMHTTVRVCTTRPEMAGRGCARPYTLQPPQPYTPILTQRDVGQQVGHAGAPWRAVVGTAVGCCCGHRCRVSRHRHRTFRPSLPAGHQCRPRQPLLASGSGSHRTSLTPTCSRDLSGLSYVSPRRRARLSVMRATLPVLSYAAGWSADHGMSTPPSPQPVTEGRAPPPQVLLWGCLAPARPGARTGCCRPPAGRSKASACDCCGEWARVGLVSQYARAPHPP